MKRNTPKETAAPDAVGVTHDVAAQMAQGLGEMLKPLSGLQIDPEALAAVQQRYLREATELWNASLGAQAEASAAKVEFKISDRRFAAAAWVKQPSSAFVAQMYLLNARTLTELAEAAKGEEKTRLRLRFAVQQWIDAASPSNYLALNAEALQLAVSTQGESLSRGLKQLVDDLQRGHVSQTDESAFEVGRNVAMSPGQVVFENEFFQLLEYAPLTAQVHERPFLMVPPCINKFYILDLQPENSLIRYAAQQGHRTFVLSWRNPDDSCAAYTWDDYIGNGPIKAIEVVREICGVEQINTLGFCVGGTLLATALGVLAARGEQPAASMTLLTTLIDFTDNGILDIFVDEQSVKLREMTIGAQAPKGPGLLKGRELATTFSFLRPNDLVWNYVVGNYLKGEAPPPFDLLYWNGDATNLPGPMYCWYLRHTYLQNELMQPGTLKVCGEVLDLSLIKAPVYLYGSRDDHIVPWEAAYRSTQVFKGEKRFMLGASGHIAGVINPPAKGKRSHWVGVAAKKGKAVFPKDPQTWLAAATEQPGSWWTDWSDWLGSHAGGKKAAPKTAGSRKHKPIEPAPGRYVKEKASR